MTTSTDRHNEKYFTVVFKLSEAEATAVIEACNEVIGAEVVAMAWGHALEEKDTLEEVIGTSGA